MNAVKHGLRAQTIILPNERQEDFDQIHNSLQEQYAPQNPAEQLLVDAAVIAQWKMVRAEVYETAAYDEEQSDIERAEFFRGMIRAQNSLARLYSKAYNELERIKSARQKAEKQQKSDPASGGGGTSARFRQIHAHPAHDRGRPQPASAPHGGSRRKQSAESGARGHWSGAHRRFADRKTAASNRRGSAHFGFGWRTERPRAPDFGAH
jgi:hypothetical protein